MYLVFHGETLSDRKVLVLNSGSSSLQFTVFGAKDGHPVAWGIAERIGELQTSKVSRADGKMG